MLKGLTLQVRISATFIKTLIKMQHAPKNPDKPKGTDLMLTNRKNSFQNSCVTDTGLFDFHKMATTTFKFHFNKLEPKIIPYRDYKYFRMIYLGLSLLQEMGIYKIAMILILFLANLKMFLIERHLISKSLLELIAVHLLTKLYLRIQ